MEALCRTSIDWKEISTAYAGAPGYSFSREYYAYELGWNFNDTHGTGIVLLAGIERQSVCCVRKSKRRKERTWNRYLIPENLVAAGDGKTLDTTGYSGCH